MTIALPIVLVPCLGIAVALADVHGSARSCSIEHDS